MCLPPCKATVANSNFELVNTSGKADGEPSNLGQQTSNHTMSSSPQPLQRGRRATRAATGVVKSIKSRFDPTAAALSDRAQHNALKEAQQRRSASVGSTRARSSGVGPQRRSKRGMDAATLAILKQAGVDAARTPPKKQQRAASRRTTSASAASPTTSARQRRHNKAAATSRSASPSPSARSARASSSARRKQSHKAAQKQAQQKQRSHRHKQVTMVPAAAQLQPQPQHHRDEVDKRGGTRQLLLLHNAAHCRHCHHHLLAQPLPRHHHGRHPSPQHSQQHRMLRSDVAVFAKPGLGV